MIQTYTNGAEPVNNAGGTGVSVISGWQQLRRFLILGTVGGTYYVSERKLTADNVAELRRCIAEDGVRVVNEIVNVSDAGRAPKNDPAIFALAACLKLGDEATRAAAEAAVPKVCRIGTHLFALAESVQAFGGWGRRTKRAFAQWYTQRPAERVAYDVIKYQQRNGWSHRDVLRRAKPRGFDETTPHGAVFRWATHGWPAMPVEPPIVDHLLLLWAFECAKRAETPAETVKLITTYGLPRECVRSEHLTSPAVWEALLMSGNGMPMTAMLRNLANMTRCGLLSPGAEATKFVKRRLGDSDALRAARVHPFSVLVGLRAYAAGHGARSESTWTPLSDVTDALDGAFYAAFGNLVPTGTRRLLALDVSGSMGSPDIAGLTGITPRVAAAAMAMITARCEPDTEVVGFSHRIVPLDISTRRRLDDVMKYLDSIPMGATDCAAPMLWAQGVGRDFDAIDVYTDSETWFGHVTPKQALRDYRAARGLETRLAVVGMSATKFSIADPADPGMLDVVGLDAATPQMLADFAGGSL